MDTHYFWYSERDVRLARLALMSDARQTGTAQNDFVRQRAKLRHVRLHDLSHLGQAFPGRINHDQQVAKLRWQHVPPVVTVVFAPHNVDLVDAEVERSFVVLRRLATTLPRTTAQKPVVRHLLSFSLLAHCPRKLLLFVRFATLLVVQVAQLSKQFVGSQQQVRPLASFPSC